MKKRHIIIGASAAGIGVLTKLRKLAPNDDILCLTAQTEMPYNTCLLADYLSEGTPPPTLWTKTADFFSQNNIELHLNTRVTEIDSEKQYVTDQNGTHYSYDTLFIGTGTRAYHLPTERPATSGLFGFQTLTDTHQLDEFLLTAQPKKALVIGAGLSGVECADALTERGLSVTIAEYADGLLPTLINKDASAAIMTNLTKAGSTFHGGSRVEHVCVDTDGGATGALLSDGTTLHADLVVVAIGAQPNSKLAANAGLTIQNHSIVVDRHLTTSHENIYAGGDVAAVPLYGSESLARSCTWPDAMQQGMFAARAMAGAPKPYPGVTIVLSSHFYGTQFVSAGPVTQPPTEYQQILHSGPGWYHQYLVHENRLKGFCLVGKLEQIGALRRLLTTQEEIPEGLLS
jgi:3-phenylpropionate/trans-cinnamate dioxygenase ferredoxin reductase subunit